MSTTLAQEDGSDEDAAIEEIVVTAEKREENILDVPLTITAFNDSMIEELGMTKAADLEQLVPGLQFGDNGEQVGQGTTIRGIGSRLAGETQSDLAVATYIDGVYTIYIRCSAELFRSRENRGCTRTSRNVEWSKLDCRFGQLRNEKTN